MTRLLSPAHKKSPMIRSSRSTRRISIRKGILSRPVYHGAFKSIELTINFSSERANKKRRHYLDISMAKNSMYNITISTKDWIMDRNEESSSDFTPLGIPGDVNYVILNPYNATYVKKVNENKKKEEKK